MDRAILYIAVLVATVMISPGMAIDKIKDGNAIGCVNEDDYKILMSYAEEHDSTAFQNEYSAEILSGMATNFVLGEPIYVEDRDVWSGLIKVRRPGEKITYWTSDSNRE